MYAQNLDSLGGDWSDVADTVEDALDRGLQSGAIEWWHVSDSEKGLIDVAACDGSQWTFGPCQALSFCMGLDLGLGA